MIVICEISVSVSFSRIGSKNRENRFISTLIAECGDACGWDVENVSLTSKIKIYLYIIQKTSFVNIEFALCG